MAEYQENSSKSFSVSSSENGGSIGSSNAEADGGDEEFYERIEAPKFVDFTVPDHYCPDDRYWFCFRVGCDQKHEEEMDSEAIYKKFVLRVMAARSPNIKLRKALERRNASRTPIKCPLSAPPKSSKPRLSRMAVISSLSEKMADEKKRPGSTPMTKTKQVAAKYLTTPRNNRCAQNQSSFRSVQNPKPSKIDVPKSRMVAKALVFHSPKKTIKVKTSVELRTPVSKLCEGMKKLEISSQKKRVLGYSSKSVKELSTNSSRRQFSSCKVKTKPEQVPSSQTCNNKETKSARLIKSKIKEKFSQQNGSKKSLENHRIDISKNKESHDMAEKVAEEFQLQESTHEEATMSSMVPLLANKSDLAASNDLKGEGCFLDLEGSHNSISQSTNIEDNNSNGGNENCADFSVHLNANNSSEGEKNGHDFMDGDDKENTAAFDENRMHNKNPKQNGRKIFGMHDKCGQIKKVAQTQDKNLKESLISTGQVMKLKKPKPTNPKPFRLRTDERRILKEANLEKRTDPPAPQSETVNLSTPGGKLQKKQGNDIQKRSAVAGLKISRGQEGSKAMASVTPPPQRKRSLTRLELKPKSSPRESSAAQRLEKFRKIKSPLQKHSVRPRGIISTKKETTMSYLIPGQKLEVIPETSPEVSELKKAGKVTGNATPTSDAAACDASRSSARGRQHATTVAVEPNFHSIHVPRSCTKKLK
ncbi:hypothetical protein CDL12_22954 [Handroanthus impetiginosus]|uniref:Uncharacterized protein n=1 Tax=Handroanthus impetiginosus TaxID=429701 RepID=A0A2G9GGU5_9LAMI|nr:hypothetical protein CDL12_22954 [Handroanthus impetiginosus]